MHDIGAIVLAGGRSSRMAGREKSLIEIDGIAMIGRVVSRLRPQVADLAINAGGDADRFPDRGIPVIPDRIGGHMGPLAGIAAGLGWAAGRFELIVTVSCDTPFFPLDLVARLCRAEGGGIAMARTQSGLHPTFSLWPVSLADDLDRYLAEEKSLKVKDYARRHGIVPVDFPEAGFDPFFNVNTPSDLEEAVAIARRFDP